MARRPKWRISRDRGVPLEGDVAASSGWSVDANPHEPTSCGYRFWIADWWRWNAESYRDHVHGMIEAIEDGTCVNPGIVLGK